MGQITFHTKETFPEWGVDDGIVWPQPKEAFLPIAERDRTAFNNQVDELMLGVRRPDSLHAAELNYQGEKQ